MYWDVYTESGSLEHGVTLEFFQFLTNDVPVRTPRADDELILEFPNNSRAGGKVIAVENTGISVEIDNTIWNLEPSPKIIQGSNGKKSHYYKIKESG
jgi:hypothetical protein